MSRNPVIKLDMAVSVSDVRLELSPSTSKMVEKLVDLWQSPFISEEARIFSCKCLMVN